MLQSKTVKLLLVEDNLVDADMIRCWLQEPKESHFEIIHAANLETSFAHLAHHSIDLIILDLILPGISGVEALRLLQRRYPQIPVIVLTGVNDKHLAVEALKAGAQEFLYKSVEGSSLFERVVLYSIERKRIEDSLKKHQSEQQVIFDSVPAMIWYKDKENRILRANKPAAESMGLTVEAMEGRSTYELYPDEAKKYHEDDLEVIMSGKPKLGIIEQYQVASGEKRWVRTDKLPYVDEVGNTIGVIVFAVDITDRKLIEDQLRDQEKRLRNQNQVLVELAKGQALNSGDIKTVLREITEASADTLNVARVGVWFLNHGSSVIYCVDSYERHAPNHLHGMELTTEKYPVYMQALENDRFIAAHDVLSDFRTQEFARNYFHPHGISSILDAPIRMRGKTIGVICHEHIGPARHWTVEEENFAASMADLVALAMESCERKKAQDQLNHLAYYDVLTDLPNRVLFMDRLNQALITAKRNQKEIAVMFLDLDQFKRINDTLGHAVGDEVLQAVGQRLKKVLYETDTLTRIGGDEFSILLAELAKSDDVTKVADKIFHCLEDPIFVNGQELYTTGSLGIAIYPNDGIDGVTLLRNADVAMYQAKEKGRNTFQLYSSAMSAKTFERLLMENSLRHALDRGELRLCYQPQVDIRTEKVVGVEALLRWQHPQLGLVEPARFITIAEETGLIVPIGEWVMRQACSQAKSWQDAGFVPVSMAVNLSDRQFNYSNLVEVVAKVLQDTGLDAKYLELELTESMIMKNIEETIDTLTQLKKMGVSISIDDFGTGHSSLMYLKRFPLDSLKIDRSFVRDVANDPNDAAIARTIIALAHNLKLKVIAEGVESREQLSFLRMNQCDVIQGFSYSRPISAEAIAQYFLKGDLNYEHRKSVA